MLSNSFLCQILLCFLFFSGALCDNLYLGTINATDTPGCGVVSSYPCATLAFTVSQMETGTYSNAGTIIILEGNYSNQPSVVISSTNILEVQGQGSVTFSNITTDIFIEISVANLYISNINFDSINLNISTSVIFHLTSDVIALSIYNVTVTNSVFGKLIYSETQITLGQVDVGPLTLNNVNASYLTDFNFKASFSNLLIDNSNFNNSMFHSNSTTTGTSLVFSEIMNVSTIDGIIYGEGTSLLMNVVTLTNINGIIVNYNGNSISISNITADYLYSDYYFQLITTETLNFSDSQFKNVHSSNLNSMILVYTESESVITMTYITLFNSTNVELIGVATKNVASEINLNTIYTQNITISNYSYINTGMIVLNLNDEATSSVTMYDIGCISSSIIGCIYYAAEYNGTAPTALRSIDVFRITVFDTSCSFTCINFYPIASDSITITEIDCVYVSRVQASGIQTPVIFFGLSAWVKFENFTAFIDDSFFAAISYYETNLILTGSITIQQTASNLTSPIWESFLYCWDDPLSLLQFNASINGDYPDPLFSNQNCTVNIYGVPMQLNPSNQNGPASHFPTSWVVFGCSAGVILIVAILAVAIAFLATRSKYTSID